MNGEWVEDQLAGAACLRSSPVEATNGDAPVGSGKRPRDDSGAENVIEIKDDEEEEVTAIAALASKKMRLEVEVKKQELKNLKVQ